MGCIGPYFVAIEIKSDTGKTSPLQAYKLDQISKAGGVAMTISPANFEQSLKILKDLSTKVMEESYGQCC